MRFWNWLKNLAIGLAIAALALFGIKLYKASEDRDRIIERNNDNKKRLESEIGKTNAALADLGKYETSVFMDLKLFSDLIKDIKNVDFKPYKKKNIEIPDCSIDEIEEMSLELQAFVDGVAAVGVAAVVGVAATGAAKVVRSIIKDNTPESKALGDVAAIGAAAIAGAVCLVKSTVDFSEDVKKAEKEMLQNEKTINNMISYLQQVESVVEKYESQLKLAHKLYLEQIEAVKSIMIRAGNDLKKYKKRDRLALENLWLLTKFLYRFCDTPILLESENNGCKDINTDEINDVINDSRVFIMDRYKLKYA